MAADFTIIAALIGAVASIIAAIIGYFGQRRVHRQPNKVPQKLRLSTIAFILVIIILIVTIAFLALIFVAQNQQTLVKITFPADASNVGPSEMVKGIAQNIPNDQQIWVIVYTSSSNRYYPMEHSATILSGGEWQSPTFIGTTNSTGERFDIYAVLVDQRAKDEINFYYQNTINPSIGYYPGLMSLPQGSTIEDTVRVISNP